MTVSKKMIHDVLTWFDTLRIESLRTTEIDMATATTTADVPAVGDRIKFRACTRWDDKAATRKVNGFYQGMPTVRYGGCPNFIVRPHEIIAVQTA